MRRKPEIWIIVILELLFAVCALSVLLYRYFGIAFDFAWLSYRVLNISISLGLIAYLTYALLKPNRHALVLAFFFSLFHFTFRGSAIAELSILVIPPALHDTGG